MKKLIYLFLVLLIVACSSDDNSNEPTMIDRIVEQRSWKSSFTSFPNEITYSYNYFRYENDQFGYRDDSYELRKSLECYEFLDCERAWCSNENALTFTVIELSYDLYKYSYSFISPDEEEENTYTLTFTIDEDGNLNIEQEFNDVSPFTLIYNPTNIQIEDLTVCE